MSRCCVNVFDQVTRKNRKCLHKRKWGSLCSFHARYYIVKIQAAWRAYKTKTKINIYKNLPSDIWGVILEQIHNKNNMYKLYKSHAMIYEKRIRDLNLLYMRQGLYYRWPERLAQNVAYAKQTSETNLKYFNKLLNS